MTIHALGPIALLIKAIWTKSLNNTLISLVMVVLKIVVVFRFMTLQAEIMKLFKEIHQSGMTFLFITHNVPLAACFCTKLAIMKDGRMVESGEPAQIMESPKENYTRNLIDSIPVLK